MAKWGVSSWLVLVRALQILGVLVSALCNGFLLVYIHVNKLGLSQAMSALEIMTCSILIYTAIVLLVQHTGKRSLRARTSLIVPFVVGDVVFTGLMLGIITVLARTGVPSNCVGLTRSDCKTATNQVFPLATANPKLVDKKNDAPDEPPDGYTTIRFGDGSADNKGVLDKYCALERAYYFISVAMIFSYMITVTLSILRICEGMYTRNNVVDERLTTATELYRLQSNRSKVRGMSTASQARSPPISPLREGVTTSPSFPSGGSSYQNQDRRQTRQQQMAPPQQHLTTTSPTTTTAAIDPAREGLLIDDGQSADHEAEAEAAMVTDGYRPQGAHAHAHSHSHSQESMPALPPYTPGESTCFMVGHGNESNEMRLSDYVKGETRAQREKDHGV
ncbi:hypothetical protein PG994_014676 [Apiospora phragmitis]|uniref:MARVEL domain-containing protein n=1 Tax=Apiospora phragmitis TaxID=2905665 RepID=A0ABR1SW14_9PEZI